MEKSSRLRIIRYECKASTCPLECVHVRILKPNEGYPEVTTTWARVGVTTSVNSLRKSTKWKHNVVNTWTAVSRYINTMGSTRDTSVIGSTLMTYKTWHAPLESVTALYMNSLPRSQRLSCAPAFPSQVVVIWDLPSHPMTIYRAPISQYPKEA